jgi:Subtilase family
VIEIARNHNRARAASGALVLTCALVFAWGLVGSPTQGSAEEAAPCGPFEAGDSGIVELAADRTLRDPGVERPAETEGVRDPGSIVPLPQAGSASAPDSSGVTGSPAGSPSAATASAEPQAPSEALLALPKNAAGAIPSDFELGPGAEIAHSFFSPVICATVARITGPPGSSLDQLVTVVPETGIVVPNDVYASAADDVKSVPAAQARAADPYASLQYGLAVSGVRAARDLGAGQGVRIALLDSAPERDHADLAPGGIESLGASAASRPAVHGTLMAGVIGAAENNGFGIAGLAPKARIVSIPICTANAGAGGQCTIYQMLQGFDRAYDAKAAIVNLSLAGPPNPLLERGVARLDSLGLVVVAAAGNEGSEQRRYPAAYPSVIGVGAVDREGRLFPKSNRGSWVELHAPGVEVLSTVPGNAFAFGSGTSLAAAHVTGWLAVLTSITGDAKVARSALFRSVNARASRSLPVMPGICDVLPRVGKQCSAPKAQGVSAPSGGRARP